MDTGHALDIEGFITTGDMTIGGCQIWVRNDYDFLKKKLYFCSKDKPLF